jgi:CO dehydrogenase maturation factor
VGKSRLVINQAKEPPSPETLDLIAQAGVELAGTVPEDPTVYDYDSRGIPTMQMPADTPCVRAAFAIFDTIVP